MFYVDSLQATFDVTLTLGDEDTNSPPPLALRFTRKGTNETFLHVVNMGDVTAGERFIIIANLLTSLFAGTGQYSFVVYDYTVPATPVEIEQGLCIVTTDPITIPSYGTDKTRKEYKQS